MNIVILQMLEKYNCKNELEYINALREIMQEIALQGLWRGKFFESAAFYGGTALRILYGLNRSSEDLDFSLIIPNENFKIKAYQPAIEKELASFGLVVDFLEKEKSHDSRINSAFFKTNTKTQLLSIGLTDPLINKLHSKKELKIKLEVDIDPPLGFKTEIKTVLQPIPHGIRTYTLPDLLAGKLHAVLFRKWGNRSKGRDWYDMVWYATYYPIINLAHLESRMRQSHDYQKQETLTLETVQNMLFETIESLDIDNIKTDVLPFINDPLTLEIWNKDFFRMIIKRFKE